MKITSIEIYNMDMKLAYVLTISLGSTPSAQNILIKINTDERIAGWGEGSPYSFITGETQATSIEAAKFLGKLLIGKDARKWTSDQVVYLWDADDGYGREDSGVLSGCNVSLHSNSW